MQNLSNYTESGYKLKKDNKIHQEFNKIDILAAYSIFISSLSSFSFGICLTVICSLVEVTLNYKDIDESFICRCVSLTENQIETLYTIIPIGAVFGAIFMYLICVSTRTKIIINNSLYILGNIFICTMNSYKIILIGRFFIGMAIGITSHTIPSYLNKISYKSMRGFVGSFHSLGIVCGVMVGSLLGSNLNSLNNYKYPYYIVIFYVNIHTILLFFIKNKKEEFLADKNIKGLYSLFSLKTARKSLIISFLLHLGQQISGINIILLYNPGILIHKEALNISIYYLSECSIMATFISMVLIDKVGRKPLLIISCILCSISLIILNIFKVHGFPVYLYMIGFNIGLNIVPWIISGEVFPSEYFEAGTLFCTVSNWLSNYLAALLYKHFYEKINIFCDLISIVSLFALAAYSKWCFNETGRKTVVFQ
jgi:MFS family permease